MDDQILRMSQADSEFETVRLMSLQEIFRQKLKEYVRNTSGIYRRSSPEPLEQLNSDECTKGTDTIREETSTSHERRSNDVLEEPISPRSEKSITFESDGYGQEDEDVLMAEEFSSDIACSSEKNNACVIEWKTPYPRTVGAFKIKCNLRIFVPCDKNSRLTNRRVYTLDCDERCKKYARTAENPNGRFENCYESSWPSWFGIDDCDIARCDLRVFLDADSLQNRQVFVLRCCGECGKFCENRESSAVFEKYLKLTNFNDNERSRESSVDEFEDCHECSSPCNFEKDHSDDSHNEGKCNLRVSSDEASSHGRRVFVLQCFGYCGKLCENHKPRETSGEYLESMDFDSCDSLYDKFDDCSEFSSLDSFKSYSRDDYHYNKILDLIVRLDVDSFHDRQVFVLR
ncbi:uncharacterized protein LOC135836991 [Planococcus citri]|uniref:uncharacterized protein LOC135836991 n=1 Tax=Planococcus citri TaxID=170843 RepID=UPI0031F90528